MVLKRLKQAREASGMTAEEVASKALVSTKTVYNAERGRGCTLSTGKRLAAALKVKLEDLI